MNLGVTDRVRPLIESVQAFIRDRVMPVDEEFLAEVENGDRWTLSERQNEILDNLKWVHRRVPLY